MSRCCCLRVSDGGFDGFKRICFRTSCTRTDRGRRPGRTVFSPLRYDGAILLLSSPVPSSRCIGGDDERLSQVLYESPWPRARQQAASLPPAYVVVVVAARCRRLDAFQHGPLASVLSRRGWAAGSTYVCIFDGIPETFWRIWRKLERNSIGGALRRHPVSLPVVFSHTNPWPRSQIPRSLGEHTY